MNFLDAAYKVLKEAGRPLKYTEITSRARTLDLLETKGQTPEATMGSRLYVDSKRPRSRFRQVSRGVFTLAEAPSDNIHRQVEAINNKTRESIRQHLLKMPPNRFEVLIGELLRAIGFREETIEITGRSGDGGVDVRGVLVASGISEIKTAVQAKRWKNNVQSKEIRELRGSLTVHEQGIIITTSDFSSGAKEESQAAGKVPISLVNGDKLIELLITYGIGVRQENHTLQLLDKDYWGDIIGDKIREQNTSDIVSVKYPLAIQATALGKTFTAKMLDSKGRVSYLDIDHSSPSRAAMFATQWKSCNGWTFWRFEHPKTGEWVAIDVLRR